MAKKRVKIETVKSHTVSRKNLPSNQSYGSSSLDDPVSTHNFPPICISVTKVEYMESIDMEYMDRYGRYEYKWNIWIDMEDMNRYGIYG